MKFHRKLLGIPGEPDVNEKYVLKVPWNSVEFGDIWYGDLSSMEIRGIFLKSPTEPNVS